ncbi:hypothetical protein ACFXKK_05140 [Streptomyces globisporus]|uniref:hypothetical protein n=1 Tax=Streptomyces globisporus TaxID=1908 RepID=UPI003667A611
MFLAEPGLTHREVSGPAGPYERVRTIHPEITATADPQAAIWLLDVVDQVGVNG